MFPEEIVPIEKSKVLVYGASGYAGRLIALECAKRSRSSSAWSAVVAGRTASKIGSVASEVGCESRVFELDRCDRFLSDVGVVVHCAGPFSSTAKPMMDACIRTGTHYLDISGEIEVFQYARSQSKLAEERGSVLCPGAGFDIVPTDCIATRLKEEFPAAREINLAFTFGTLPSVGTLHTVIEGLALGGVIRRDGFLAPVSNGYRIRRIRFQDRSRWCVSIPWADVYTSGISTGVPNGMVLTAMPWIACQMVRATSLVRGMLATKLAEAFMKRLANLLFSGGPSRRQRMEETCQLWGEALGEDGQSVQAWMSGPNVYSLTVLASLGIAEHCLSASPAGGFYTASRLMGSSFGLELPGCRFQIAKMASED